MTVAEVVKEVEKDRAFYRVSGGGMTLAGGEPMMQPAFAAELLKSAKDAGMHTVLDTSGFARPEAFRRISAVTDLVLFDLKLINPCRHQDLLKAPVKPILDNLRLLADLQVPVVVRVPVIPGYTDSPENLRDIAAVSAGLKNVQRVELMRYNRLGEAKWRMLGLKCPLDRLRPPDDATMNRLKTLVQAAGAVNVVEV